MKKTEKDAKTKVVTKANEKEIHTIKDLKEAVKLLRHSDPKSIKIYDSVQGIS